MLIPLAYTSFSTNIYVYIHANQKVWQKNIINKFINKIFLFLAISSYIYPHLFTFRLLPLLLDHPSGQDSPAPSLAHLRRDKLTSIRLGPSCPKWLTSPGGPWLYPPQETPPVSPIPLPLCVRTKCGHGNTHCTVALHVPKHNLKKNINRSRSAPASSGHTKSPGPKTCALSCPQAFKL